jgi:hypothetical protein
VFSKRVLEAYGGLCALCGIDSGLVEGAHVYPASAPGSPDEVWNGLALCANHHTAFDQHLLWIGPKSRGVRLHPSLRADANSACRVFVSGTFSTVRDPGVPASPEMLARRYDSFDGMYAWAAD